MTNSSNRSSESPTPLAAPGARWGGTRRVTYAHAIGVAAGIVSTGVLRDRSSDDVTHVMAFTSDRMMMAVMPLTEEDRTTCRRMGIAPGLLARVLGTIATDFCAWEGAGDPGTTDAETVANITKALIDLVGYQIKRVEGGVSAGYDATGDLEQAENWLNARGTWVTLRPRLNALRS
jgi:hypothetical protein